MAAAANTLRSASNTVRFAANTVRSVATDAVSVAKMRMAADTAVAKASVVRSEVTTMVAMTEKTAMLSKVTSRVTETTSKAELSDHPNDRLLMLSLHNFHSLGRHLVSVLRIEGLKCTISRGSESSHHQPDSSSLSHGWNHKAGSPFLDCDCLSDATDILLSKLGQTALDEHIKFSGLKPVLAMSSFELNSNAVSRAVVAHESKVVIHHMDFASRFVDLALVLGSSKGVNDGLLLDLPDTLIALSDKHNRAKGVSVALPAYVDL